MRAMLCPSSLQSQPTNLVIHIAHQGLQDDSNPPERTSLIPSESVFLLEFCLNATYAAFCNTYYQQIHSITHPQSPLLLQI